MQHPESYGGRMGQIDKRYLIIVPKTYKIDEHDGKKGVAGKREHNAKKNGKISRAVYLRSLGEFLGSRFEHVIKYEKIHSQKVRLHNP